MALHQTFTADPAREAALALLDDLLGDAGASDIAVRLWEGTTWRPPHSAGDPRATLVLKDPGALRTMLDTPSDLLLGEMYIFDDLGPPSRHNPSSPCAPARAQRQPTTTPPR